MSDQLELRNEDADDGPYLAWQDGDYADHADVAAKYKQIPRAFPAREMYYNG